MVSLPDIPSESALARLFYEERGHGEATWFALPGGATLFKAGEPADHLYFLRAGRLGAFRKEENGEPQFLGVIRPGEPAGEMSLITGTPHSGTVVALRDSEIFALPRDAFFEAAEADASVMTELARLMILRTRQAASKTSIGEPSVYGFVGTGSAVAVRPLLDKVARANAAIFDAAARQPQYAGMGTTLVAALFHNNQVTVAHVGDSRLYRLRGGELSVVTRDHSLLQEQIDSGLISREDARYSQNRNLVTRALGVDPVVEAEINDYPVFPGDIYLLCSDGLNDMVEDEEIQLTLQTLSANLELAATQLIEMANDNGGRDNVSVILVKVLREFPAGKDAWSNMFAWFKAR